MKLKYDYLLTELFDKTIAIPVDMYSESESCTLSMNEMTMDVIERMKEDTTREKLISELLEVYDATREQMETEVDKVLQVLSDNNLIEE